MGDRIRRLPSPAMTVAFIALLAALGGTAVALPGKNGVKKDDIATGAVNSTDIANNSIRGGDVRTSTLRGSDVGANTLTGSDINESSLGKVQSAGTADSAGTAAFANSAGNANSVGGQQIVKINARLDTGAVARPILNAGGLQIIADCVSGDIDPIARTSVEDSSIMSTATNGSLTNGTFTDATDNPGSVNPYSNDTRRGSDASFDIANTYAFDAFAAGEGEFDDDTMHNFTYVSATGAIVTGQFLTQESTNSLGSTAIDCYVTGHATVG